MSSKKEFQDLETQLLRNIKPLYLSKVKKNIITEFGEVRNELVKINHSRNLRQGEILAQWIKNSSGKKTKFIWLGIIYSSRLNLLLNQYEIFYRPFVSQEECYEKRFKKLYTEQLY